MCRDAFVFLGSEEKTILELLQNGKEQFIQIIFPYYMTNFVNEDGTVAEQRVDINLEFYEVTATIKDIRRGVP